jgi:ABC-type branched-subunit amino acid transport system substrate-binding protein
MRQRSFLFLICALTLSGCGEQVSGRYGEGYELGSNGPGSPGRAAFGQKIAILLPLTGPRADVGKVLLQAAQLALGSAPALDVIDTAGTPAGAVTAAQTAVANRDSVVLGPLTSAETSAVAPIAKAASIPVLAFTNDSSQAQPGVWTLGITPSQQIRRLVVAASAQGKTQFAALLPSTDFGHAMANGLTRALAAENLPPATVHMHGSGMAAITSATREVSDYADRRGPIEAKVKAARAEGTPEGRHEAQDLMKTPIPPPSFNVLLLADTGEPLQEIASLLPYYDVDRYAVQIVGPALWSDPSSGSGAVSGAWYAAPDNAARAGLERDYAAKYGSPPPPLADLAYDGASVAAAIISRGGAQTTVLTQPAGFVGTDGWLAFLPDGQVRRGLAVFRIERGGPALIDPAPQSSAASGS